MALRREKDWSVSLPVDTETSNLNAEGRRTYVEAKKESAP